ncbi:MAG TPA: efflux RND transporter periplasmic adaptor subunit [Gallionellaceae bacterium]|nr:efflux RND transporter periplasmic adaptor subunit [Gallionellaceae bacterium]
MKQSVNKLQRQRLIAALLFPLLLAACGAGDEQKKPAAGAASPPAEVDVIIATPAATVLTQDLPGRLQAYRSAQVRARVEGIVERRKFTEGSDVIAGASLYQIALRSYQTAYDAAKADAEVASQTLARYKKLKEANVVSQQDYDLTDAKYRQAEARFSKAQEDLENTRVPAPISGRIGRSQASEGALVGRGEATLLTTIEQINPLYVNFTQSESEISRLQQAVKAGKLQRADSAKVELVLEDGSIYAHSGKFLFSDMAVDPNTGSVSLRAEFPNPKFELLPGMFVNIRLPQAIAEKAIKVPQRAVQTGSQGQFVLLVDADGKVSPRPVKTGSMAGEDFIIAEGLQGGEQVIVNGVQKARPGGMVKAVPWNPNAPVLSTSPAVAAPMKQAAPATPEKK